MTCSTICCHQEVFSAVVGGKRRGLQGDREDRPKNKKSRHSGRDEEYYIPYRPKDFNSERGWADKRWKRHKKMQLSTTNLLALCSPRHQVKPQWGGNCFWTAGLLGRPGSDGRRRRPSQPTQKHNEMVRARLFSERVSSLLTNVP